MNRDRHTYAKVLNALVRSRHTVIRAAKISYLEVRRPKWATEGALISFWTGPHWSAAWETEWKACKWETQLSCDLPAKSTTERKYDILWCGRCGRKQEMSVIFFQHIKTSPVTWVYSVSGSEGRFETGYGIRSVESCCCPCFISRHLKSALPDWQATDARNTHIPFSYLESLFIENIALRLKPDNGSRQRDTRQKSAVGEDPGKAALICALISAKHESASPDYERESLAVFARAIEIYLLSCY